MAVIRALPVCHHGTSPDDAPTACVSAVTSSGIPSAATLVGWNPRLLITLSIFLAGTRAGSASTASVLVANETLAAETPGMRRTAVSILAVQDAQSMPSTRNRSACTDDAAAEGEDVMDLSFPYPIHILDPPVTGGSSTEWPLRTDSD